MLSGASVGKQIFTTFFELYGSPETLHSGTFDVVRQSIASPASFGHSLTHTPESKIALTEG